MLELHGREAVEEKPGFLLRDSLFSYHNKKNPIMYYTPKPLNP